MINTYRIVGSGPLAGVVADAQIAHLDLFSKEGVTFDLGQEYTLGDRIFSRVNISSKTGAAMSEAGETDLLRLDPVDLPRLQDVVFRWSGYVG